MSKLHRLLFRNRHSVESSQGIWSMLRRIWHHLSPRRKWQLPGLAVLMLISGVTEAMTLGAVMPFLGVIVAPEQIFDNPLVARLARVLEFSASEELVLPLTVAFALTALAAGAMKLLLLWCSKNYVQRVGYELAVDIYRRTLYQPYQVHLAYNTSEIIGSLEKINTIVVALNSFIVLVSAVVTSVAIVLALVAIEPLVAVAAFFSIGGFYGLLIYCSRQRFSRNSRLISSKLTLRVKALQEGLGSIRDVLLNNSQPFYCNLYRQEDWLFRQAIAENAFMAHSPRYGMESLGMVLIAASAYILSQQPGGGELALPLLGTLALGAQRLLPALQQIFATWAFIRGYKSSAEDVLTLLDQPLPKRLLQPSPPALNWQSAIEFDRVKFRYGEDSPWVLQDVSFCVPKCSRVGFVGTTGSGKSTVLDILMGLLEPTVGEVLVDGLPLRGEYCRAWQQAVAHVPQHIYLSDTTIAENIALGIPKNKIDFERVRYAAKQAQIAELIEREPQGYWAALGERGIRLSGGERQRIGIARALYRRVSVLIFDEATSALDNTTEREVMAAINELGNDLTIVMVAHRLSTLEQCDLIIELDQGRVVTQGNYQELMDRSPNLKG